MEELSVSLYILAIIMGVVAFAYSSVGLGGASSYTAIMAIAGMSPVAIPAVSLSLNLVATSIGSFNFIKNRHGRLRLILPFLLTSIPFSYIGGSVVLPRVVFYWLLLLTLSVVAVRIYFFHQARLKYEFTDNGKLAISLVIGSILGFVAGAVGIGGGIYLVPLVIIFGLGNEKEAAACGAVFIWLNSAAGLAARLQYQDINLLQFWPVIIAVIVGAVAGSLMGATRFSPQTMQRFLGVIILVAIGFLLKKLFFG